MSNWKSHATHPRTQEAGQTAAAALVAGYCGPLQRPMNPGPKHDADVETAEATCTHTRRAHREPLSTCAGSHRCRAGAGAGAAWGWVFAGAGGARGCSAQAVRGTPGS